MGKLEGGKLEGGKWEGGKLEGGKLEVGRWEVGRWEVGRWEVGTWEVGTWEVERRCMINEGVNEEARGNSSGPTPELLPVRRSMKAKTTASI